MRKGTGYRKKACYARLEKERMTEDISLKGREEEGRDRRQKE